MALRNNSMAYPAAEIDYQDYQVMQWLADLPPLDLQQFKSDQPAQLGRAENTTLFLAAVLHARGHQLRNMIYRPVLYSFDRIHANKRHAQTAVNICKESVQLLILLSRTTTFVSDETLFFQDFLIAAFGAILLAVCNAPGDFSGQLGDDFFDVLSLCRDARHKSNNTFRTWSIVRRFEIIAPRLGLARRTISQENLAHGDMGSTMNAGNRAGTTSAEFYPAVDVAPTSALTGYDAQSWNTESSDIRSWLHDDSYAMSSGSATFGNEFDMLYDPNGDIARVLSNCENLNMLPVDPTMLSAIV